jgi:hypothetical protein
MTLNWPQVVQVDPACLPPEAQCKGYEDVVVQDVLCCTEHARFQKEKFYSVPPAMTIRDT